MSGLQRAARWSYALVIGAILTLSIPASASAALIIDGEGGTPAPGGRPLNHNLVTSFYSQALRFTLAVDTTITGIQAMIGGTRSGAYTVSLADVNNLDTDNNLFTYDAYANLNLVTDPCCFVPVDRGQYMGRMDLSWFVTAGDYWLKFSVPYVGPFAGFDGYLRSAGHYEYMAAADIADPGGYRDFGPDHVAVSIYGFAGRGGAVPEPATWGLMLLGFMSVSIAMRRRGSADQAGRLQAAAMR